MIATVKTLAARAVARREYWLLTVQLTGMLEDLRGEAVPQLRAGLLNDAAALLGELAARHHAAWGRDLDEAGLPAVMSIMRVTDVLARLAETELALARPLPQAALAAASHRRERDDVELTTEQEFLAEWDLVAELGKTRDRAVRAGLVTELHQVLRPRAGAHAQLLLAVADSEWHLAGVHERCCPPRAIDPNAASRTVIGAVFFALGALIAIGMLPLSLGGRALVAAVAVTGTAAYAVGRLAWLRRRAQQAAQAQVGMRAEARS